MKASVQSLTLMALGALVIGACSSQVGLPVVEPSPSGPDRTPLATIPPPITADPAAPAPSIAPVSATKPSADAAAALAQCQIGKEGIYSIEQVAGMGKIARPADVLRYVPLTGKEPILRTTSGPVWVIQFRGDIPQFYPNGVVETWTDPICVVTPEDAGFLAVGPVKNESTGESWPGVTPPPGKAPPDLTLPPLAP